eukprot:10223066-Heterocapsa_arctica.AAC.1
MHNARVGCRFGCGLGSGDSMLHYLNCVCLRRAAMRYFTLPPMIEDDLNLRWLLDVRGRSAATCLNNFL